MATIAHLTDASVIPDVIPQFTPKIGLRIGWSQKVHVSQEGGNKIPPSQGSLFEYPQLCANDVDAFSGFCFSVTCSEDSS
jgi:hypothetical protein